MLNRSLVPLRRNNSCHKWLMKTRSLSEIIVFGIPCRQQISVTKTEATLKAVNCVGKAMKWAYFESLSTTTIIALLPPKGGNPTIRSMVRSSQIVDGGGKG